MKMQDLVKSVPNGKKGQAIGIRELVTTLAVAGILFIVGVLIFSKVDASIDTSSFTTAQNATVDTIRTTVLDSFELGVISLIVLAAVVILAVLFTLGSQ
ncbi:MAG: hypothetical protein IH934_04685 [Nanoarchaeota archaeon]|nr:hypothetical protein [Nanoarchaeota archaeon]